MDYQKQAKDFLRSTNTKMSIYFKRRGLYFDGDTQARNIYEITLRRGEKVFIFSFGQSLNNTKLIKHPTAYDVLACLQKYGVGTFEDFCSDFGYNTGSRRAHNIYLAVLDEVANVLDMFGDVIDELREIR